VLVMVVGIKIVEVRNTHSSRRSLNSLPSLDDSFLLFSFLMMLSSIVPDAAEEEKKMQGQHIMHQNKHFRMGLSGGSGMTVTSAKRTNR